MLLKVGSRGPEVLKLQEGLAAFGFHPGSADGVFGPKTADALDDWQAKVKLYPDGIFGPGSLKAWNVYCTTVGLPQFRFDESAPAPDPREPGGQLGLLGWTSCPTDKWKSGYTSCTLRSDTAISFKRLCDEVHARGGIVTSAGGKRSLASKAGPARSTKSFHYTGRAFDLSLGSGMQDPDEDPYIVVRDDQDPRKWVIWAKVLDLSAPLAKDIETVTLNGVYCVTLKNARGQKYTQIRYKTWTGQAFSFTELCTDLGFQRISGRRSFFKGGAYTGSEWWHFQWETGLVRGQTPFGEELLKVYTPAQCKRFVYWEEAKNAVFGVSWF